MPIRSLRPLAPILALLVSGAAGPIAAAQQPPGEAPLAIVDGEAITDEEVENALGAPLRRLQEQIYTMKQQKLEALIGERLLRREAARRGVSVAALLDAEVTPNVGLVTEQEVEAAYRANRARFGDDESAARARIRSLLQTQKLALQREAYVRVLRSRANVVVNLAPPPVARVEVSAEGPLGRGPATAPVTIVEFTDFHCPFCKRAQPTVSALLARYPDKIRHVHRDFPIDSLHPDARRAHEAARCAADQGKFWEYHDAVFANAPKASPEQLKGYARQVGLEGAAFARCLDGGTHREAVQADYDTGIRLGVTGTPTFFINGRQISGAQPLERFVSVIEDELTRPR